MKILVIEPGKHPYEKDIEHTLENLQSIVGGHIEAVYPFEDEITLVCHEEALFDPTQQWNRIINPHLVIKGTFFLCGLGTEDFTDLPDDILEKYKKHFWDITHFIPRRTDCCRSRCVILCPRNNRYVAPCGTTVRQP